MKTLHLELSLEEINLALEALGDLPFHRVHGLVGTIQQQAQKQLQDGPVESHEVKYPETDGDRREVA